jgi:hypothetical protein
MDIDNAFANPEAETDGVWIDYRDGSKVKLARLGNKKFRRVYEGLLKPHLRKQRDGTLDSDIENNLVCKAFAKSILLDWDGFTQKGKPLKYSEDVAYDLLVRSMDFRNDISELSQTEETFHLELADEAEKN